MSATHFEEQPGKIDLFSLSEAPGSLYEQDARTLFQELKSYGRPDLIECARIEQGIRAARAVEFANTCEEEFAHILELHQILWRYKPRTFAVEWDEEGNFMDSFTPGFYLPAQDRYLELAPPDRRISSPARKVRLLRQQYSSVKIDLIIWNELSMEI